MKNFLKKYLLNKFTLLVVIVVLVIWIIVLYGQNRSSQYYSFLQNQAVPYVELVNNLSVGSDNFISGQVVGFVAFEDQQKQPKDIKQYVEITASKDKDEKGQQLFYERDIIKMNFVAPRYFDPVILKAKDISKDTITLTDNANNLFFINKNTWEVAMLDATGDMSKLIVSENIYKDFMKEFFNF